LRSTHASTSTRISSGGIDRMVTDLRHQIRKHVSQYLAAVITLGEFQDWFIPIATQMTGKEDQETQDQVYEIELRLAEYTGGYWSEAQLKEKLAPIANQILTSH
jgi:hypothetical protein